MISTLFLFLLSFVASDFAAKLLPSLARRDDTSNDTNTFASIVPSKNLSWVPCYRDFPFAELGPISCARLIAPLDYENASHGEVQLAIIKLGASGDGQSKRTVFVNPGGAGGDPVEYILNRGSLPRAQVGNETDLIAIVLRGVGSTFPPITCDATKSRATQRSKDLTNAQPGYSDRSLAELYAEGKAFGLDCGLVTPHLVSYAGTVHVARDMDYVLQALGQEKLSYLGYSYGSVLGATYAALFPDKVDRMVLDSVLDFNNWYEAEKDPELDIGDAEAALNNFFKYCFDAGPERCAFWYDNLEDISDRFFETDRRLLAEPLAIPGFGILKTPAWRSAVYSALYSPEFFSLLAAVTAEIYARAPGSAIQSYIELIDQLDAPVDTPLVDPDTGLTNSVNVFLLIACSDSGANAQSLDSVDLEDIFDRYRKVSEFFGGISSQLEISCLGAGLKAKERYTKKFKNIKTGNPILFVGNVADPTTPLRKSVLLFESRAFSMSEAFPGSAVLAINGTGHLSYSATRDNECADRWIVPYFQSGTLPPPGTVCDGKQNPFDQELAGLV